MLRLVIFALFFIAVVAVVATKQGWWPAIRLRPFAALLLGTLAFGATFVGGTKPPVDPPDPPPIVFRTNTVLRLYFSIDNGRLYPIEALLREVQP